MLKISKKKEFSSVQVELPKNIADRIFQWGKKNIDNEDVVPNPYNGSSGREKEGHLTVKFGLHTSKVEDVEKVVNGFGSFDVELDEVSKFEKETEYHVLKIGVKGQKLLELNKLISKKLECTDTYSTYQPHVTIAYVKTGSCEHLVGDEEFKGVKIKFDKIVFSSKDEIKRVISL